MLNFVDEGDYFTDLWDEELVDVVVDVDCFPLKISGLPKKGKDSEIQPPHFARVFSC